MSNGLPYYKAYPRDFIEGTMGMSFEVKGAYRLLLDIIYMRGGSVPDDARAIAGILGCSVRKWTSLKNALVKAGKIQLVDGIISNYRADKELIISRKFQDNQRESAAKPRKNKGLRQPKPSHTDTDTYKRESNDSLKRASARGSGLAAFRAELAELDDERLDALVTHRRSKRGQMTALSARLFRRDAEACGLSLADAVDTCISRNWITVKPEYLAGKARATSPPHGRGDTVVDAMNEIFRERGWTTDEPEQFSSHSGDGERLSADEGSGKKGAVVDLRNGAWRRTGSGD